MDTDNFKAKEVAVFPECGEEGNRVRVYRNLHKDCWSVKNFEPRHPLYNRVVAHAEGVNLEQVKFIVSDSGYNRVHAEGRKNVHAYVQGRAIRKSALTARLMSGWDSEVIEKWIKYNPRVCNRFHFRDEGWGIFSSHERSGTDSGLFRVYESSFCHLQYPEVLAIWENEEEFIRGLAAGLKDTKFLPVSS